MFYQLSFRTTTWLGARFLAGQYLCSLEESADMCVNHTPMQSNDTSDNTKNYTKKPVAAWVLRASVPVKRHLN